jgi:hypothetical protein
LNRQERKVKEGGQKRRANHRSEPAPHKVMFRRAFPSAGLSST